MLKVDQIRCSGGMRETDIPVNFSWKGKMIYSFRGQSYNIC